MLPCKSCAKRGRHNNAANSLRRNALLLHHLLLSSSCCVGQSGLCHLDLIHRRKADESMVCSHLQHAGDDPGDVQHLTLIPDRVHVWAHVASKSEAELEGYNGVVRDGFLVLHTVLEAERGREIATARLHVHFPEVLLIPQVVVPHVLLASRKHVGGWEDTCPECSPST
eukprot:UN3970